MNTNITGFLKMVFKRLCTLVLWTKVASALEGLEELGIGQAVIVVIMLVNG